MKRHYSSIALAAALSLGLSAPLMAQDHHGHEMDSSQPGTDTWITTKVKADLLVDHKTPGTDISVDTKDGVVWLSGHVATQAEKEHAIQASKGIKGVKKVEAGKLMVGAKKM